MSKITGTSKIVSSSAKQEPKTIDHQEEYKKTGKFNRKEVQNLIKGKSKDLVNKALEKSGLAEKGKKFGMAITTARGIAPFFDKTVKYVDYSIDYMMNRTAPQGNRSEVVQYTRGPSIFGIWVTLICLLICIIWGVLAPLNSAAIAMGQVMLESKKRIIQHHEGGVIERIYIKNGDEVEKGEILLRLDKTAVQTRRNALLGRVYTYEAEHARLIAERDFSDKIKFSNDLLQKASDHEVSKIMQTQQKLFKAKHDFLEGATNVRKEKIKQSESKVISYTAQLEATQKQIDITSEQLESYKKLFLTGNVSKDHLRKTEQSLAELEGRKAQYLGAISESKDEITKDSLDIENVKSQYLSEVEKELRQNQEQLSNLVENLKGEEDNLAKLDIISPISGVVNNLFQYTEGGTIQRDQPIMDIIPTDDKLVIDAKINIDDIDVVRVGQTASVRLTPFKSRIVPALDGKIVSLSADMIPPQMQGDQPHYKARIEIDKKSLDELKSIKGVELYPGMQANVSIEIGTRTFLKYLLDPITTTFGKAFVEQ